MPGGNENFIFRSPVTKFRTKNILILTISIFCSEFGDRVQIIPYKTKILIRKIDTFHIIYDIFAYMDLTLAKSFLLVSEIGSISEAANRLRITQSALSRRIQQFEKQLGGQLIYRSRKGIELTEIGKIAFNECGKLI